jgi:hypothetical protein
MVRAKASGVDMTGSTSMARRAAAPGSTRKASARACWMRRAISGGRPAGATTPYQKTPSKPFMPRLSKVGTSGSMGERFVTAKPVRRPSRTSPAEPEGLSSITATVPFIRSG